jgi:putative ABC transport system permease protein
MEVVVGHKVATELSLTVGSHFHGSHGFDDHGHVHEEDAYHVSGVLEPTGSVIDRLILSNISSVWKIHSNHEVLAEEAPNEITAMLIKYKSPMAMMQLPRMVNQRTSMQASLPAIEINRLYSLLGVGFQTVRIIGCVMLIVSAISVFISLLSSLKERRFELALLRCLGGAPVQISSLLIFESLILCLIGWLVGVVLSKLAIWTAANYSDQEIGFSISNSVINTNDVLMLGVALFIGLMASVLPAFQAYGTNLSKTLRSD